MLDVVEKLFRIVFTIMLGGLVAVMGLKVQWDRIGVETDSLCFNQYDTVAPLLQKQEVISKSLVERYAKRCEVTMEQAGTELAEVKAAVEVRSANCQSTSMGIVCSATQPSSVGEGPTLSLDLPSGDTIGREDVKEAFVAIGKAQTDVFAQVNFDTLDGRPATGNGSAPAVGEKLQARWEVNLRQNTNVTTGGQNPVVGLVATGQCVEVMEAPESLRTQFWAKVKLVDC